MKGKYGSIWNWDRDRLGYLKNNHWYRIEQHLKLNTPGKNDGVIPEKVDPENPFNEDIDLTWRI